MPTRRLVLSVLSGLLVVAALILATVDLHADDRNCGSALITRDTSDLGVDTGTTYKDDFATQEVLDDCAHDVLAQRFLCVGLLVVAAGIVVWSRRSGRGRLNLPGDPII